ncbi:Hypothetical predicted protein [Mytilus galloprovincialis]|uniref:CCHC-type domain-containing protein n=1 Tax=Mytilus galloprovincialis TaxID=29158 RepID=A0A8B6G0B4_MYTGA|nr:Hypothetical predicted protein [Mytilus galloprovincialis]
MSDEEDFSHEPDVRDTPSRAVPRTERALFSRGCAFIIFNKARCSIIQTEKGDCLATSYSEDSFKGRSSNNSQNVYSQSEYYGGKKSDKCFYCNAEGHFAYQCPKKASRLQSGKQF